MQKARHPAGLLIHMVGRSALYSKPDVLPRLDPEGKVSSTSDLVDVLHVYSKSPYPEKMMSNLINLEQGLSRADSPKPPTRDGSWSV